MELCEYRKLITENLVGKWDEDDFVGVRYPLTIRSIKDKKQIRITFKPHLGNFVGGIFDLCILKVVLLDPTWNPK